jgi:hypothetical protein
VVVRFLSSNFHNIRILGPPDADVPRDDPSVLCSLRSRKHGRPFWLPWDTVCR